MPQTSIAPEPVKTRIGDLPPLPRAVVRQHGFKTEGQRTRKPGRPSKTLLSYESDPEKFAYEVMKQKVLTPEQVEVLWSVRNNQYTAVCGGNGNGKTHIEAIVVPWYLHTHEDSCVLTVYPKWKQVVDLLWSKIYSLSERAGVKSQAQWINFEDLIPTRLVYSADHMAKAHNAQALEAFSGEHKQNQLIVLGEASGIQDHVWVGTETMMQTPESRLLVSGNPYPEDSTDSSRFFKCLDDPKFNVIYINNLHHPNIIAELKGEPPPIPGAVGLQWVRNRIDTCCQKVKFDPDDTTSAERMVRSQDVFEFPEGSGNWYIPDDTFRIQVMGRRPRTGTLQVWSPLWIERMRSKCVADPNVFPKFLHVGVDVGRLVDPSVIYIRRGISILRISRARYEDQEDTCDWIERVVGETVRDCGFDSEKIRDYTVFNVDSVGGGFGLTSTLRRRGYRVCSLNGAHAATEPKVYNNLRSELWFKTAYHARDGEIDLSRLPPEDFQKLKEELLVPSSDTKSGRIAVDNTASIREKLGRSPDDASAFNYCYADVEAGKAEESGAFTSISRSPQVYQPHVI